MNSSDIFSINRFGLLIRQYAIHNYRLFAITLIGFCGGLFILFLMMQLGNDLRPFNANTFFETFLFISAIAAMLYTGTAFPGLRTREKSFSYLLNPASVLEKFLLEFISRILLFIVVVPFLYWIMFHAEGYFLQLLNPEFNFTPFSFTDHNLKRPDGVSETTLMLSGSMLLFTVPFGGSSIFMKYPLPKTLFAVAAIFFFHAFLVYFFLDVLDFASRGPKDGKILGMDGKDALTFFAIYSIVANTVMIAVAYLKLKEREV